MVSFYFKLAECPQYYCGEIGQLFKFIISLTRPKAYHKSDHPLRIFEYHRIKLLSLNPRIFFFAVLSAVISFKDFLLYEYKYQQVPFFLLRLLAPHIC
jgi:hypothetical protein